MGVNGPSPIQSMSLSLLHVPDLSIQNLEPNPTKQLIFPKLKKN